MTCGKCGGLALYSVQVGYEEAFKPHTCINCGNVVDRIIVRNRKVTPKWRRKQHEVPSHRGPTDVNYWGEPE